MRRSRAIGGALAAASVAVLVALALASCATAPGPTADPTAGVVRPRPWTLSTPQAAVRSYLAWTTYAYRMADSDLATATMGDAEEVRVDSYVQLNKDAGKLIDQRLVSLTFGKASIEGTRATLPARESWVYSYRALDTARSLSPTYSVSYETTYTLVSPRRGVWLVDSVDATAHGQVK